MTLDQLIAEVAKAPTQIEAFTVLMKCLEIEMKDASAGDSAPPSVQTKYDAVFSSATGKAHEILAAIETGKPTLEPVPVKEVPASDPRGPVTPIPPSAVFVDKPATEVPSTTAIPEDKAPNNPSPKLFDPSPKPEPVV
jgi:hypothetical protein